MKKIILFVSFCFCANLLFAQKLLIDSSVYGKWPQAPQVILDNDGKYVCILTGPNKFEIKSTNGSWEQSISGRNPCFALNGKKLVLQSNDTLFIKTLGTAFEMSIPGVTSFGLSPDGLAPRNNLIRQRWLAYFCGKQFIILDLKTNQKRAFNNINDYNFIKDASGIILQEKGDNDTTILQWCDLLAGTVHDIWKGKDPIITKDGSNLSDNGEYLAFAAEGYGQKDGKLGKAIWYYHKGEPKALCASITNSTDGLVFGGIMQVNNSGDIFFGCSNKALALNTPKANLASVDIYSYRDAKLQSQQLFEKVHPKDDEYMFVFNIQNKRIFGIAGARDEVLSSLKNDHVLVLHYGEGDKTEDYWNPNSVFSIYLISIINGEKKHLYSGDFTTAYRFALSPHGKFVVHFDARSKNYISYNVTTGLSVDITKGLDVNWINHLRNDEPDSLYSNIGIAGWLENDTAVILKTQTDLIQADPEGLKPPLNLTGGLGHRSHIRFSLSDPINIIPDIAMHQALLLSAINLDTKDIGFCKIIPDRENSPQVASWIPFSMDSEGPYKSIDHELYLIGLQNAQSPRNAYLTTDFIKFIPVTNAAPQKNYNWLSDELITWNTPDGKVTQGILYKPENFDPKKQYPLIFEYYEQKSEGLHKFLYPDYPGSEIDIPTYVSNGYLVFVPDIHYQVGHPGQSAYNSVVSAAQYLYRFPWVDTQHMGLVGHSFGGFETDYIIAHSHLFAAACSGAGMTDFISAYGSIIGEGKSRQYPYEQFRDRMGTTPWQRPDLYVENSPVLGADKINTPVLFMANWADDNVPPQQGFELFNALRRLQKPAWLLQYDGEGHGLNKPIDKKDYAIRVRQFFDYYLKGLPPPQWMTTGIPATLKQVVTGYELDTSGKRP